MIDCCLHAYHRLLEDTEALLGCPVSAAYAFGSYCYGDFHAGYSDLDFQIVVPISLTEKHFAGFHALRAAYKEETEFVSLLEGEFLSYAHLDRSPGKVVYWGTSKDKLAENWDLRTFSLWGLLEKGRLLRGEDCRAAFPRPTREEMTADCRRLAETIGQYSSRFSGDIHDIDWIFLASQSLYWLETGEVAGKTQAAQWLGEAMPGLQTPLAKAIGLRRRPETVQSNSGLTALARLIPVNEIMRQLLEDALAGNASGGTVQ